MAMAEVNISGKIKSKVQQNLLNYLAAYKSDE